AGKEANGKLVLGEDGLSGTVSEDSPARPDEGRRPAGRNPLTGVRPLPMNPVMGQAAAEESPFKGGAYRIDTGLPDPAWFQVDPAPPGARPAGFGAPIELTRGK